MFTKLDFIKVEVPRIAKIRKNRKKNKGKGVGKSSNKAQKTPGQEGAQFLTVCESGDIVGATWSSSPPTHEAYLNNQKVLQARTLKKGKLQNSSNSTKAGAMPGHESAQDPTVGESGDIAQDQEVLELGISKKDTDILYVDSRDNNNKKPEQSKAGPSGQRGRVERGRKREKGKDSSKAEGKPERRRRSSPEQKWIKFFHEKGTPDAKIAARENSAHQLLVHGLPREFLESTTGGPQEKALNQLLMKLGKTAIGDRGITIEQEHIIGAHPMESLSSSDKSPITRLTVDSRETKDKIRKAAEITGRWGTAGGHAVFLRDIPPEKATQKRKRTSSNEDKKTPKKPKCEVEETPRSSRTKKEEGLPRRRLEVDRTETRREERARTVGSAQAKLDAEKYFRIFMAEV